MGSKFKINRRSLDRLVDQKVDEVAREYQQALASLALELKGRPVEEVKPLLRARVRDLGGEITDPELTNIATAISQGTEIVLRRE